MHTCLFVKNIYIYIYIFNEKANRILEGSSGYKNSKNVHLGAS